MPKKKAAVKITKQKKKQDKPRVVMPKHHHIWHYLIIVFVILMVGVVYQQLLPQNQAPQEIVNDQPAVVAPKNEQPALGSLTVLSSPTTADVLVNTNFRGQTPLTVDLAPGVYVVEVGKKGFESDTKEVTIIAGQNQNLDYFLSPVETVPQTFEILQEEAVEQAQAVEGSSYELVNVVVGERPVEYFNVDTQEKTQLRDFESDLLTHVLPDHIVITRLGATQIKVVNQDVLSVGYDQCSTAFGTKDWLYPGETLCIVTQEGTVAAFGGTWEGASDLDLIMKVFE